MEGDERNRVREWEAITDRRRIEEEYSDAFTLLISDPLEVGGSVLI